jgi:hypothetical protein
VNQNSEITENYNKVAKEYDKDSFGNSYGKFIDSQERQLLGKLMNDSGDKRVPDVACGTGRFLNFAIDGIDASEAMVAKNRVDLDHHCCCMQGIMVHLQSYLFFRKLSNPQHPVCYWYNSNIQ